MRITVDTNILISSTFWMGDSDRIIGLVENKKLELILSEEIIEEFVEALGYEEIKKKVKNKDLEMKRTVKKIVSVSEIIKPKQKIQVVKEDPDDNKIIECAVAGKAKYIVTKDKHLLKIKEYKEIKIITPKELLKIIKKA